MDKKSVAFYTLGCKVNQQETAGLRELFQKHGYKVVDFDEPADVYVINTCTVTHLADRKSRQMVRRASALNPMAVVAVVGCYAQVSSDEVLALDQVDVVVGTQNKKQIVELVEQAAKAREKGKIEKISRVAPLQKDLEFEELPLPFHQTRTRAFLKIEDGCDQHCAYCIVPLARGPVRSLRPEIVEQRLTELVGAGFREVVLTGIHTSAYGKDLAVDVNLAGLLRALIRLPGEFRLRLSSVEPADVTDELLDVMVSSPKICRHLHLPLQSGDDEILRLMRRPYTAGEYRELFCRILEKIPGVAVTSDVIVGFPGETEQHFENTYRFITSLPFRDLHVFKYSPRPGTAAFEFPGQVSPEEKDARSSRLRQLADSKARAFAGSFVGSVLKVLVERHVREKEGLWEGLSDNYLRVLFPSCEESDTSLRGSLVSVKILGLAENDLLNGELL